MIHPIQTWSLPQFMLIDTRWSESSSSTWAATLHSLVDEYVASIMMDCSLTFCPALGDKSWITSKNMRCCLQGTITRTLQKRNRIYNKIPRLRGGNWFTSSFYFWAWWLSQSPWGSRSRRGMKRAFGNIAETPPRKQRQMDVVSMSWCIHGYHRNVTMKPYRKSTFKPTTSNSSRIQMQK